MIIRKAYKFRLKVTPEVKRHIVNFSGHARFVYNKSIRKQLPVLKPAARQRVIVRVKCQNSLTGSCWELNMARLDRHQRIIRYSESCAMLKFWKQTDERSFLNECHSQVLQQKLKDLDRAFSDGFDILSAGRYLAIATL